MQDTDKPGDASSDPFKTDVAPEDGRKELGDADLDDVAGGKLGSCGGAGSCGKGLPPKK